MTAHTHILCAAFELNAFDFWFVTLICDFALINDLLIRIFTHVQLICAGQNRCCCIYSLSQSLLFFFSHFLLLWLACWLVDWLSKFALFIRIFFISVSKLIFSFNNYTEHRDVIRKLVTLSGILMFFLLHRYIHWMQTHFLLPSMFCYCCVI